MVQIKGFPDYLVDECGRIFSLKSNRFLKPSYDKRGYASVELFRKGESKKLLVHRIVAEAFILNPDNLPQINHIDENPRNNNVNNLEWCTAKYNMNYGNGAVTRHSKIDYSKPIYKINAIKNGKKACKPILMFTKDGKFISEFCSAAEAERKTGIDNRYISAAATGKNKTAKGYIWKFKEGRDDLSFQY